MPKTNRQIWSLIAGATGIALIGTYWIAPYLGAKLAEWSYLWALPYASAAAAALGPVAATWDWVKRGKVQSESVALLLAVGLLLLRRPVDAAVIVNAWALMGSLHLVFRAQVHGPVEAWEQVVVDAHTGNQHHQGKVAIPPGQLVPADGQLLSERAVIRPLWNDTLVVERQAGENLHMGEVNLGHTVYLRAEGEKDYSHLELAIARATDGFSSSGVMARRLLIVLHRWAFLCSFAALGVAVGLPLWRGDAAPDALQVSLSILALAIPGSIAVAAEGPYAAAFGTFLGQGIVPFEMRQLEVLAKAKVMLLFEQPLHGWSRVLRRLSKLGIDCLVVPRSSSSAEGSSSLTWQGKRVRIISGQEIPTLRSWVKSGTIIGALADPDEGTVALEGADVGIALGAAGLVSGESMALLSADVSKLPWIMGVARRMRRLTLLSMGASLLLRLFMVVLVAFGYCDAPVIVVVDAALAAIITGMCFRLGGKRRVSKVSRGRIAVAGMLTS